MIKLKADADVSFPSTGLANGLQILKNQSFNLIVSGRVETGSSQVPY